MPATHGLVIEGVTGAGKTSVLAALRRREAFSGFLGTELLEDQTFGELMDELKEPEDDESARCWRLWSALVRLERANGGFVLERFHPSYYALLPDWSLYEELDEKLWRLGARVVLLSYDEALIDARALERPGAAGSLEAYYGSKDAARKAVSDSMRRRRECLGRSALPWLELDASSMDWERCADRALEFCLRTA